MDINSTENFSSSDGKFYCITSTNNLKMEIDDKNGHKKVYWSV